MPRQIIIALATEGNTDILFLPSIIKRTFENIALDSQQDLEIFDPVCFTQEGNNIQEKALNSSAKAINSGASVLCFHADADSSTDNQAFKYRIDPAFAAIKTSSSDSAQLIAVVPIQMVEAWMLADKELFQRELGTNKNTKTLGVNKNPESFSNPKLVIEDAIRTTKEYLPKRLRYKLTIDELYSPIGQKINLSNLMQLSSYRRFEKAVRQAFEDLGYF